MKELDVLVMLGRPGRTEKYPLKQQSAWEWRFLDGHDTRFLVVTFDAGVARLSARQWKMIRVGSAVGQTPLMRLD